MGEFIRDAWWLIQRVLFFVIGTIYWVITSTPVAATLVVLVISLIVGFTIGFSVKG